MVIIFDLDDTLYDERSYVSSGLKAVAKFGEDKFGWDSVTSYHMLVNILEQEGRGAIFDQWLSMQGKRNKGLVGECIRTYRHHNPRLQLFDTAEKLLPSLSDYPLYVVTDGHKIVQEKKINALGIKNKLDHIYITHRYGIRHAKPSTYCFELIRKKLSIDWSNMIYIGDNPAKDFVSLNTLGVHTVRVLTGAHRKVTAKKGYDALHTIPDLGHFKKLLESLK